MTARWAVQGKHLELRRTVLAELVLLALSGTACGATFPAGCSDTVGDVSALVGAIHAANNETANPGTDTIVLTAGCSYSLSTVDNFWYGPNGLPAISSDIVIEGNGATITRASAAGTPKMRLFYISGGLSVLPKGALTLHNLTLSNGLAQGGNSGLGGGGAGMGGAIFNQGTLTLSADTLVGNSALGGSSATLAPAVQAGGGIGQDAQGYVGGSFGAGFGYSGLSLGGNSVGTIDGAGGAGFAVNGGNAISAPGAGGGSSGWGGTGGCCAGGLGGDGGGGGTGAGNLVSGGNGGGYGQGGSAGGGPTGSGNSFGGGGAGGGGVGGGGGGGVNGGGGGGGFGGGGGDGGLGGGGAGGAGGFGGGGGSGAFFPGAGGFGGGTGSLYSHSGGGGAGLGGAIFNHNGALSIVNCTLTANTAQGGTATIIQGSTDGAGLGGAIFNLDGTVYILQSTLAFNNVMNSNGSVGLVGGALYNLAYLADTEGHILPTAAGVIIHNSILSDSSNGSFAVADLANAQPPTLAGNQPNIATASITADDHNIVQASDGTITGMPVANAPRLAALADNAGPTQTIALQPTSPAIDAGDPCVANLPATDQRGYARIWGIAPDLGAYEYASQPGSDDDVFHDGFEDGGRCR
jgi:hypothetical protein